MKPYIYYFCVSVGISLLVSCSSVPERHPIRLDDPAKQSHDHDHIRKALYSQFLEWQGVRYQPGGLSRRGIDCSGFVHLTFKSKLGMHLPRTTWMQSRIGKSIENNKLRSGDLVFFKTGPTSQHVGIYLEKNRFLHASQKKGVTISHLDNVYWKSRHWKSVRI